MRKRESRTVRLPRVAAFCRADSADAPNARDDDDDIEATRLARSRRGSSRGNSEHFFFFVGKVKTKRREFVMFFRSTPYIFEGAHFEPQNFFCFERP